MRAAHAVQDAAGEEPPEQDRRRERDERHAPPHWRMRPARRGGRAPTRRPSIPRSGTPTRTMSAGTRSFGALKSAEIENSVCAPSAWRSAGDPSRPSSTAVTASATAAYASPDTEVEVRPHGSRPATDAPVIPPSAYVACIHCRTGLPRLGFGALRGDVQVDVDQPVADAHQRERRARIAAGRQSTRARSPRALSRPSDSGTVVESANGCSRGATRSITPTAVSESSV